MVLRIWVDKKANIQKKGIASYQQFNEKHFSLYLQVYKQKYPHTFVAFWASLKWW